jgi:hypothetical protein
MEAVGALVVLATAVVAAVMPGTAAAARVTITHAPEISGTAHVGETLTAVNASWRSSGQTRASYNWVRCGDTGAYDCELIDDSPGTTYRLTSADLGKYMRVWLAVTSGRDRADAVSAPSAAVTRRPTTPPPSPTPTPSPSPTPTPSPDPDPEPQPEPQPDPQPETPPAITPVPELVPSPAAPAPTPAPTGTVLDNSKSLRWMRPFPIVRIRGWLTPRGARVTVLTVRAPRGARIKVRCTGRGCPRRSLARSTAGARSAALVHLRPYERHLSGSLRIEISVTRTGYVGKRTVILLRRGKAPARRDLCLYPGARKAKVCPAP